MTTGDYQNINSTSYSMITYSLGLNKIDNDA